MIIIDDETSGPTAMPSHLAQVSCPDNCQHEVRLLFQHLLAYQTLNSRSFAEIQHLIGDNQNYMYAPIPLASVIKYLTEPTFDSLFFCISSLFDLIMLEEERLYSGYNVV